MEPIRVFEEVMVLACACLRLATIAGDFFGEKATPLQVWGSTPHSENGGGGYLGLGLGIVENFFCEKAGLLTNGSIVFQEVRVSREKTNLIEKRERERENKERSKINKSNFKGSHYSNSEAS